MLPTGVMIVKGPTPNGQRTIQLPGIGALLESGTNTLIVPGLIMPGAFTENQGPGT